MPDSKFVKAVILVEPEPKARARKTVNKKTNRVYFYTPPKTVKLEAAIRNAIVSRRCFFIRGTPLYMEVTFFRSRPASLSKNVSMPTKRPDLDNYLKVVTDALEKFVYADDSQITTALIKKRFGQPPRIELLLRADENSKEM
jgi:Holliday junction resolvase RusA-like endonuclease